jgi:hypothetical protein
MGSRRRFRPRHRDSERSRDTGTKGERPGGWPSNRVGRKSETGVRGEGATPIRVVWSRPARKARAGGPVVSVPETDTGGRGEQPQVSE